MANVINLNCGEMGVNKENTVRTDLDLTKKKKPWEKGFADTEEHAQKSELRGALGDSAHGIANRDVEKK